VLDKIIHDVNLEEPYYLYVLRNKWAEVVGETLAVILWPVTLENKILCLQVKDEHWKKEVQKHKQDILKKIQHHLKDNAEIKDIVFN